MTQKIESIRADFPILSQQINGNPLVYLDNGATTQKPKPVIDAISDYYLTSNSNVHRGAHTLSDRATIQFENARKTVASFINSPENCQVLWSRGTTESINMVAQAWGHANLKTGDCILVSELEHHSNIVPWQMAAKATGAVVIPIPISDAGDIDLKAYQHLLDNNPVKVVSVNHVSNALGTVNPVKEIIEKAKNANAITVIDGAQAVAHFPVDVQAIGCDFYVFSAHKLFGPTGIGVLWGKKALLEAMPPYQGGGEMIEVCDFDGTTYNQLPYKFEAGTPDIAGAIGLAAAIDYLNQFDRKQLSDYENDLLKYATEQISQIEGIQLVGTAEKKAGVVSFLMDGTHPSDVGMMLDEQGIAVRTGHHCTQPLMKRLGIPGTIRASFTIYNNYDDIDRLVAGLIKVKQLFG